MTTTRTITKICLGAMASLLVATATITHAGVSAIATGPSASCMVVNGAVKCWGDNSFGRLGNNSTVDSKVPVQVVGLTSGATAVSVGTTHACAVVSGVAMCWGANTVGQLGNGNNTGSLVPVAVSGLGTSVTSIASGNVHNCVTDSGAVKCWGANNFGQLGNGNTTNSNVPVQVGALSSGGMAVSAGDAFSCAVVSGGAQCWGANGSGQLGDSTFVNKTSPVQVTGLTTGVTAVAGISNHACALVSTGAWCWGNNAFGQLGDSTNTNRNAPVAVSSLAGGVASIAAGQFHSCAVDNDQAAKCWGRDIEGQLGNDTVGQTFVPGQVGTLFSLVDVVAAGFTHSCAAVSGVAQCWGNNTDGQLGDNSFTLSQVPVLVATFTVPDPPIIGSAIGGNSIATVSFTPSGDGGSPITGYMAKSIPDGITGSSATSPVVVSGLMNGTSYQFTVTAINVGGSSPPSALSGGVTPTPPVPGLPTTMAAGSGHSCAVFSGGLQCWGLNTSGQLGNGTTISSLVQLQTIAGGSGVTDVAAGDVHTCAVVSGAVKCWGNNTNGRLGDGTTTPRNLPVIAVAANATAVAAGNGHTCAVVNGGVKCWGTNGNGQLGDNTLINRLSPVDAIPPLSNATAVATGDFHSCAVVNGGVKCWGYNGIGGLGDGSTTQRNLPVQVSGIPAGSGATSVAAGNSHSCAVVSGEVRCWGFNGDGNLGNGITTTSLVPVQAIATGATAVATGGNHNCAVVSGGVQCWGRNGSGQVGNNTTVNSLVPVQAQGINGGSNATAVGVKTDHSCAVVNSAVQCWGSNADGQFGTNNITSSLVPVNLAVVPGAPTIGAATPGNTQATVTYIPPGFDGGALISSYMAKSNPGNITGSATAGPIIVSGLTNGTTYTFDVVAINAVGASIPSGPSNSMIPTTLTPPTITAAFAAPNFAVGGGTNLTVTIGNGNGSAITLTSLLNNVYPIGMVNGASGSSGTCPGVTATMGNSNFIVGNTTSIPPGGCTVIVSVISTVAGAATNTIAIGGLQTSAGNNAAAATATVNVYAPPLVTKTFTPTSIGAGGTSSMVITVTNPGPNVANITGVVINDTYTGTLLNNAAGAVLCSGAGSATLSGGANMGNSVGFTAGTIEPGGTCTITQSVTATTTNINSTTAPTASGPVALTGTAVTNVALNVSSTNPVVTNVADSGAGSLRQAILDVNTTCSMTPQTITFAISGAGPHTIAPSSMLPTIDCPDTTIDGYSQTMGAGKNSLATASSNTDLRIIIDGVGAGPVDGIAINAANALVTGLSIVNFTHGIHVFSPATGARIAGNFIGLLPGGAPGGNVMGVVVDASGVTIGGPTNADRNLISSNSQTGIELCGVGVAGFTILRNVIGTAPDGSAARGNGKGISAIVPSSSGGIIGLPNDGNFIEHSTFEGIFLYDTAQLGDEPVIEIPSSIADTTAKPSSAGALTGPGNTRRPSISEKTYHGGTTGQRTDIATIKGSRVESAQLTPMMLGTRISGNTIRANGTTLGEGINSRLPNTEIDGNAIEFNSASGIRIVGLGNGSLIHGNSVESNAVNGIEVDGSGPMNVAIYDNTIANNSANGIVVLSNATGIDFSTNNNIVGNGGIGVDLANDGPTANLDATPPYDGDTGPNQLLNFPNILSVTPTSATTANINFELRSTTGNMESFAVCFCKNPAGGNQCEVPITPCFTLNNEVSGVYTIAPPVFLSGLTAGAKITALTKALAGPKAGNVSEISPGVAFTGVAGITVTGTTAFPATAVAASSGVQAITITNSSATAPLIISSITHSNPGVFPDTTVGQPVSAEPLTVPSITLSNPSYFANPTGQAPPNSTPYCGFGSGVGGAPNTGAPITILPGNTCVLNLIFAPNAPGALTGTITINSNAPTTPTLIVLTGTGLVAPVITSATTATGTVGTAFSYAVTATNTPASFNATSLPPGLSVNTGTGLISGTPTVAGTFVATISATNVAGTGTQGLSITIAAALPSAPSITSPTIATGITGTAFSYSIAATNSPTGFGASGLPAGLGINTSSGLISGTPTVAGTFAVTISATNAGGTATQALSITITASTAAPIITSAAPPAGTIGTAYSHTFTATGTTPITWSISSGTLPTGLTLAGSGGLSGTPTTAGSFSFTVQAANGTLPNATQNNTIVIAPLIPVVTSAATATGTTGTAFSYAITATNTPTSYGATGLPAGLSVNSTTGLVSGTPTVAGTFAATITATNAGGTGSRGLSITIAAATLAPAITSSATATGTTGTAFSYAITATNTPTSFGASGLPAGLSVNTTTGLISGTPTVAGASSATITATNAGGTGSRGLSITIAAATVAPVITSATAANGTAGTAFSYTITATNTPTSFGASGLPAGLSVNTTTGLISGTPTAAGISAATITATNAGGTGSQGLSITIAAATVAPVITSATAANGTAGTAFSYTITATNTPTSFGATGLPAGLSVNTSTGLISGTPTVAGTVSATITATNAGGTGSQGLSITITAATVAPTITTAPPLGGTVGTAYSHTFAASGTTPITWSVNSGSVPTGLTLNPASGILNGTPTTAGSFTFAVQAANGTTPNAAQAVTIVIAPAAIAPTISFVITPTSIFVNGTTVGTVTIINGNATPLTANAFTFTYVPGLVNAPSPNATSTCSGANITAVPGAGSFSQTTSFTIPASGSCTFSSTTTAAAAGTYTGAIPAGLIVTGAGSSPASNSVTLTVTVAPAPVVLLAPPSVNFGAQTITTTSPPTLVTLTNTGTGPLTISSITGNGDFGFTSTCPLLTSTVAPQAGCAINVTFTPLTVAALSGAVSVASNAAGSPHRISLSGSGTAIPVPGVSIAPATLAFAAQTVGTTSATQNVTVTNTGFANLSISSINVAAPFSRVTLSATATPPDCGASVAPGSSCQIGVAFRPAGTGALTGSISITDNAVGSPHTVSLSGTGTPVPVPVISVTGPIAFGDQNLNTTSASRNITISNTGTATLTISAITITGTNATNFTLTGQGGCASIAAASSCTLAATFTPSATGARSAQVSLTSNAQNATTVNAVALSGNGTLAPRPVVSLSITTIGFGNIILGGATPSQTVTLTNTGGQVLNITNIAIAGDFAQTNTCGTTVAAQAACVINILFTPGAPGGLTGELIITSDSATSPDRVQLSGTGCRWFSQSQSRFFLSSCG